jgi:hypothetical protein
MSPGFKRLRKDVESSNGGSTRTGRHVAGQNPHRGSFSCTVRSQKSYDFSFSDFKTDLVDAGNASVFLGELLDFDH